jgi:hypothetical protein
VVVVVTVFVGVCVIVLVGVTVEVIVGVGLKLKLGVILGVGVGVTYIVSPSIHPCVSIILITILSVEAESGTVKLNGNTDTVATETQFALKESQ